MCRGADIPDVPVRNGIDDSHFAVGLASILTTVAHVEPSCRQIVGFRVGPEVQRNRREQPEIAASIDPHLSGSAVGREQFPQAIDVAFTLRLFHAAQAPQPFAGCQIHDLDRVVSKRGDEKPPAESVGAEVVDPARDVR